MFFDRHGGLDVAESALGLHGDGEGIPAGAQHQVLGKRARLPHGEIDLGHGPLGQVVRASVAHHADDQGGRPLATTGPDLLAHGDALGEVTLGEALVDDRDLGCLVIVRGAEIPP